MRFDHCGNKLVCETENAFYGFARLFYARTEGRIERYRS